MCGHVLLGVAGLVLCLHMVAGVWPIYLLKSGGLTCEAMYKYRKCTRSSDCLLRFEDCQCVPGDVMEIFRYYFSIPVDPKLLCLYTAYVMKLPNPSCCESYYDLPSVIEADSILSGKIDTPVSKLGNGKVSEGEILAEQITDLKKMMEEIDE